MKLDEKPMRDCLLCDGYIQAGEAPENWGFDWSCGWVHLECAKSIGDAARRIETAFAMERGADDAG